MRPANLKPSNQSTVPLLDLADFRSAHAKEFSDRLRDALVDSGFVRLEGHGIDPDLVSRTFRTFETFFGLPEHLKASYSGSPGGQRGFTPFGVEHAKDHLAPDLKEFYHVGRQLDPGHPLGSEYPANIWPEELPDLRSDCIALYEALDQCATSLLEALALGFRLPPDTFSRMLVDGNSILRILHYPPHEACPGDQAIRAAPHEDINLITLLCEASEAGLEILDREGNWLSVECHPGEIVADAGDMLSRIVNDVIPATTHRVVSPDRTCDRHRYAMPYFAHPYPDCDLSVHEAFTAADRPAQFPPINARDFLNQRLREIGLIP